MATTQNASASIVPTVSTAAFKPLSLDEIMMVPLAKQAQEDQLIMDAAELDLMTSNAIGDSDKTYINAQNKAYQDEIAAIRDRVMTGGVDRSLINKFKRVRERKNQEFSLNGTTGRANAAYNQMMANKQSLMKRTDLDEDTKRLGLAEASRLYEDRGGALGGAEYEDFFGVGTVDYMAEAQKVGAQMSPQQIAGPLGLTYDKDTGSFKDGSNSTVILTPEQIQRVAYDTLASNNDTIGYLEEQVRLGRLPSVESALQNAAVSAGNIYQKNNSKVTSNYPSWANGGGNKTVQTMSGDYWDSDSNLTGEATMMVDMGVDDEAIEKVGFTAEGAINPQSKMPDNLQPTNEELKKMSMAMRQTTLFSRRRWLDSHQTEYDAAIDIAKMRRDFPLLQGTNPQTGKPFTDKEIYTSSVEAKKKMAISATQTYLPRNMKNTYRANKADMLLNPNDKTKNGRYISRHMSIGGFEGKIDEVAEQLGIDQADLEKAIRETGFLKGITPGHPQIPGADAFGFNIGGEDMVMYLQPQDKVNESFAHISTMNKALIDGTRFTEGTRIATRNGAPTYSHIQTELNPYTNELDQYQIKSPIKLTKEEFQKLTWAEQPGPPRVIFAIDDKGRKHVKFSKQEVEQDLLNRLTSSWDRTPNAPTPHSVLKN